MSQKNLTGKEAVELLKELTEKARICMFSTSLAERPIPTCPMSLQECDEEGNLWFISMKDSEHNKNILNNAKVQLFFMNNSNSEYVSVYGAAKIYDDIKTIEEKWSMMANAWFEGKEDPDVSIIKVKPENTYYWDTKAGKMVTMASFVWAIVSGNKNEDGDGLQGNLNV